MHRIADCVDLIARFARPMRVTAQEKDRLALWLPLVAVTVTVYGLSLSAPGGDGP